MGKRKIERRREVDELKFRKPVKVPTLKERMKKGLSDKEWIMICYRAHKDAKQKCFREIAGHSLCNICPKSRKLTKPQKNFGVEFDAIFIF